MTLSGTFGVFWLFRVQPGAMIGTYTTLGDGVGNGACSRHLQNVLGSICSEAVRRRG